MRILHIITGLGDGGAEAVLFRICKLDKEYHHIVISLQGKQKYVSLLQKCNISVHTLNFTKKRINIFGNGKQVRDVLYIDDLVKLINKCIIRKKLNGDAYNVGGGGKNSLSLLNLYILCNFDIEFTTFKRTFILVFKSILKVPTLFDKFSINIP